MPIPVLIVIPTHGRPVLLGRTLESVAACDRPVGYAGCLVVENGPKAGAESVVAEVDQQHPEAQFQYLHVGRANKSNALNEALAGVPAETLCVFFDDDVRVASSVLTAYAEAAKSHEGRAYWGGPVSCDYEETPPPELLPLFPRSVQGYELCDRGVMAEEFLGFNWAAFAGGLREAGGFDPSFGPGSPTGARGQESDMQRRLRGAGARPVDVPSARVWHFVPRERSTAAWLRRRHYQHGLSRGLRTDLSVPNVFGQLTRAVGSAVKHTLIGTPVSKEASLGGLHGAWGCFRARVGRSQSMR